MRQAAVTRGRHWVSRRRAADRHLPRPRLPRDAGGQRLRQDQAFVLGHALQRGFERVARRGRHLAQMRVQRSVKRGQAADGLAEVGQLLEPCDAPHLIGAGQTLA
jgi:hypothetical protein